MNPARRRWLALLAAGGGAVRAGASPARAGEPAGAAGVPPPAPITFPRDHGAHLTARTEWWYATGWIGTPQAPTHGLQLTFFRSATGLAAAVSSRFAARHLLFAHAALTDLGAARHRHDQRIARWSGARGAVLGDADERDGAVRLGNWSLRRDGEAWQAQLPARDFALQLRLRRTQPVLLQGRDGWSRKGPEPAQASHYYSEVQLDLGGRIDIDGRPLAAAVAGRAWLDHEWSDELLHPQAVGWDWAGVNLFDGGALTVFALRRADGRALWAGGSHRGGAPGSTVRAFEPAEVNWQPQRLWASPASGARYPVQWAIDCPAGRFTLRALMDAQELDSRQSTGTVYWEGLSELLDAGGRRVGLGYLEMTGYVEPLRLR